VTRALELAERAVAAAEGDAVEAVVQAERSGFARFAGSEVHQPTLIENESVFIRVIRGQRAGEAAGNRVDEEGLRELAARAEEAADASPDDPDLPTRAGASELPNVAGNDDETAALGPDDQARLAANATSRVFSMWKCQARVALFSAREVSVTSAGERITTVESLSRAASKRCRCVGVSTDSGFTSRPLPTTIMSEGTVT